MCQRVVRLFWIVVAAGLLVAAPGSAQTDSAPIIFLHEGDLYSYRLGDAEPFQETHWGYNQNPVLSPDGRYVAYNSIPEEVIDLNTAGVYPLHLMDRQPPTNIWVMEIATREFQRVAFQPQPIGDQSDFLLRSRPAWSPDSQQLAWLEKDEYAPRENGLYLVIHDLETGTQTHTPDHLVTDCAIDADWCSVQPRLAWGATLAYEDFMTQGDISGMFITTLNSEGVLDQWPIAKHNADFSLKATQWQWVEINDGTYLAFEYDFGWVVWGYQGPQFSGAKDYPVIAFLQGANGGRLRLHKNLGSQEWVVSTADVPLFSLPQKADPHLSVDGQQLIYRREVLLDGVSSYDLILWEDGQTEVVLAAQPGIRFDAMVWQPMVWRIDQRILPTWSPVPGRG